jgi:hypothetical protein
MDVLYLDYDNVLHGEVLKFNKAPCLRLETPGQTFFQNMPILEQLLGPYPDVKIVLSTSWVRVFDFYHARKHLSASLQARVVGATFHALHMYKEDFARLPRHRQILADAARRQLTRWLAIDDDIEGWPQSALDHLVPMPPSLGLSCPLAAAALKARLATIFA